MRLGYLQAYNELNWVGYQIDHMMSLCDELVVVEGSQFANFPEIPERSTDGTIDIIKDKIKEYSPNIKLRYASRTHGNYRKNQCDNYNSVLDMCKAGDYFVSSACDEFFYKDHIEKLNYLMKEGKADILWSYGHTLAFSFKWQLIINDVEYQAIPHIWKKNDKMYFLPAHKAKNTGPIVIKDTSYISRAHYNWVKPQDRLYIRHKISDFFKGTPIGWFNDNWEKIELTDKKEYEFYGGKFVLKRFNGRPPESLDNHHWKDVEDIRLL